MLIDKNKLADDPLDNLSFVCPSTHVTASLGQFGCLSTEMICTILENADLFSIMRLRATCVNLRGIINDWEPFREIMADASDVLSALLATKAAVMFTVPQISNAVFTTRCEFCGECGTFLQLLKLARCCFRCLANDRRLLSVPLSFAQNAMGVNPQDLPRIPHLTTIQRESFWGICPNVPSYCAVDYTAALDSARSYPVRPVSSELESYLPKLPTILQKRRQKAQGPHQRRSGVTKRCNQGPAARPLSSYPITTIQPLVNEVDINPPDYDIFRFLSAMHAPGRTKTTTFDPQTKTYRVHQSLEQHRYCRGCRFYWNLHSPHLPVEHTIYTSEELPSHIQSCFYARLLWGRLYPGGQVDESLSAMLLKRNPALFQLRHPSRVANGNFEQIPQQAMYLYTTSDPDDNWYGDALLGSQASASQATWATSNKSAYGALHRSIYTLISRKSRKGVDVGPWVKASQLQVRRPTMIRGPQCINGLPTSSRLDPSHTEPLYYNGKLINLWFEDDNTQYPMPSFLDALGQ